MELLFSGFILVLVGWAAWHDLRTREIPDWVSLVILAAALLDTVLAGQADPTVNRWIRLGLGAVLGILLAAPWFYWGALGGGDVKLLTVLGAFLGPIGVLALAFWTAVSGGVLAFIAKRRGQADYAYGPAIWIGLVATMLRSQPLGTGRW